MKKSIFLFTLIALLSSCHVYRSSIYGPYEVQEVKQSKYSDHKHKYYLKAVNDGKRKFWEPGRKISYTTDSVYVKGDTLTLLK